MNSTADETENPEQFIIIPPEKLSQEAFQALVEEFILREGTDYGHSDPTLDDKMKRLLKQIQNKHIFIVYSTATENTSLMTSTQLEQAKQHQA